MLVMAFWATCPIVRAQKTSPKILVSLEARAFQSIEVGSNATKTGEYGDVVSLKYASREDYLKGVKKTVPKQLKVASVGTGYAVDAAWYQDGIFYKTNGNGNTRLPAGDVLQIAMAPTGKTMNAARDVQGVMKAVYASSRGTLDQELDVMYAAKPLNEEVFVKMFGLVNPGAQAAKYQTHVQYTIVPN